MLNYVCLYAQYFHNVEEKTNLNSTSVLSRYLRILNILCRVLIQALDIQTELIKVLPKCYKYPVGHDQRRRQDGDGRVILSL